ncbi:MAG: 30S ribosomal protein S3 [archaeon]
MEERNTVKFKKDEFNVKEYIKESLGKGKVSRIKIEYTPVGEKVIVSTHKPGIVIGRKGEKIHELTMILKNKFKLENPSVEIDEIKYPEFDAQIIADEIALGLERFGPLRFKVIAYRTLQKVMKAGALGVEIKLGGKLPSKRARKWKFTQGYLKKTGNEARVVDRAQAIAQTKPGTVGVKVAILSPHVVMKDRIKIDEEMLKILGEKKEIQEEKPKKKVVKKKEKKEDTDKKETKKKITETKVSEDKVPDNKETPVEETNTQDNNSDEPQKQTSDSQLTTKENPEPKGEAKSTKSKSEEEEK